MTTDQLRALADKAAAMCSAAADGQDYHEGFVTGVTTLAHLLESSALLSPELGGWRGIEEAKVKAATMSGPEADGQDYHDGFMCGLTTLAHLLQQPLPPPPTGAR